MAEGAQECATCPCGDCCGCIHVGSVVSCDMSVLFLLFPPLYCRSEANDLAVQIAQRVTRGTHIVTLEGCVGMGVCVGVFVCVVYVCVAICGEGDCSGIYGGTY